MNRSWTFVLGVSLFLILSVAQANDRYFDETLVPVPPCNDLSGRPIIQNNAEVIRWKVSTPNQFRSRALVVGRLFRNFPARTGHLHFEVDISASGSRDVKDHIEVIYNTEFGDAGALREGDEVAACGDYITSNARSGHFPPSPVGAIIHWVHMSPNPGRHPGGFVVVNGRVIGQNLPRHDRRGNGRPQPFLGLWDALVWE